MQTQRIRFGAQDRIVKTTPKLSLEGHHLLPVLVSAYRTGAQADGEKESTFLTVYKKPITNLTNRAATQMGRPVGVTGKPLDVTSPYPIRTSQKQRATAGEGQMCTIMTSSAVVESTPHSVSPRKELLFQRRSHRNSQTKEGFHYYFYLGPGNNCLLVNSILLARGNWLSTISTLYSLRWEQSRPRRSNVGSRHRFLSNLFPNHQAITDKGNLLQSLKNHCAATHCSELFSFLPVCFEFKFNDLPRCQEEFKRFLLFYLSFSDCSSPLKDTTKLRSPQESPNNRGLRSQKTIISPTNKKKEEVINAYKKLVSQFKPYHSFQDFGLKTHELPCTAPLQNDCYGTKNMWLLKPTDLNRGRGIHVFSTLQELGQLLSGEFKKHNSGSFLVQKYIERPLLIDGRKFDIRMWVLVTHLREAFIFEEGYIRLSSEPFSLQSKSNFTHLTNNAVQKHSQNYGLHEEGNIISLNKLYELGLARQDQLSKQMQQIVNITLECSNSSLSDSQLAENTEKISHFQIFGYDFMLDISKHLWLIEVNTNPCIETPNTLLEGLVPRMLDDALKMTIDKVFSPKLQTQYPVQGYDNAKNMWIPLRK